MKNQYVKNWLLLCCAFIFMAFIKVNAANFLIADGDVTALKNAITTSNTNSQPDTITLAAFGTYTLTTEAYTGVFGSCGLPIIWEDGSPTNELHILGNGATITRDASAPYFRLMNCINGKVYIEDVLFTNGYINSGSDSGGALVVNGGTYYITNCTFSNNRSGFEGGAFFILTSSTVTVSNCTFSGNTALYGSAIYNWGAAVLYIYNSTIVGNTALGYITASGYNGGCTVDNTNTTSYYTYMRNSIVANNTITALNGYEVNGATILQGGNILGSANASLITAGNPNSSGDYVGTVASPIDAKVNALADNGGFTPTVSLQSNSPAINKGNIAYNVLQDQRGYARVGALDIGAYEYNATKPGPVIASSGLSVTIGPIGTVLTISGINMTGITQIKFQGAAAVTSGFTNNTDKSVTVTVPAGTTSGKITVTTAVGTSALSAQTFTVGIPVPTIASTGLSATSGPVGSSLTITGTNLSGITEIKFQGAAAVTTDFTNNTATSVTVIVPAGATSGKITVTTAIGGTSALSTQSFTVTTPVPVISSTGLSATSGTIGSSLTITGTNFTGITQIKFQGTSAVTTGFTNNTATSVTVTVPVGATTGKITVTTAGGTSALSAQTFTVTSTSATTNATLKNVELYPNPFEETFTIDLNGAAQTTNVRILSVTGEVLKEVQLGSYSTVVDTNSLDSGIYMVYVFNEAGEQMTYRMVKK